VLKSIVLRDTDYMSDAFEESWRLVKEDEPDCDCITTDMSGNCLHCNKTSAESMNEREGGGWEDCPGCGVERRIGEMCHNQDPKNGRGHCDGGISKAMTDEEMVYVKIPKSMLPLIEMLAQRPQMWSDVGSDMGGHFGSITRDRPNEADMFGRWNPEEYAEEGWTPEDELGPFDDKLWMTRHDEKQPWGTGGFDYHDHDSDDRGVVRQIDLVEALKRLLSENGRVNL
jgi:hypothetical protein